MFGDRFTARSSPARCGGVRSSGLHGALSVEPVEPVHGADGAGESILAYSREAAAAGLRR